MNVYRTLLWWLALALLGALLWDWLATDPGTVVVQLRGKTITTTVAFALAAWALAWFVLWAVWWLLRLPLRIWRRHTRNRERLRLISGLEAMQQSDWGRAGSLLEKAVAEPEAKTVALLAARQAAEARSDHEASARLLTALAAHNPLAAALEQAQRLLSQGRANDALATLKTASDKPLPPRGLRLQIEASIAAGCAQQAMPALTALRQGKALPPAALAELELQLSAASLREATAADVLTQRWHALPARLQDLPTVAGAYAQRAAALGLETAGGEALANALSRHWDESWLESFSKLPTAAGKSWLSACESWLPEHPNSPALLVALGHLCHQQQLWGKAEDYLHRALAQGAGSNAWEALGHVFSAQGDTTRAHVGFANALRLSRGESALSISGRTLRDQIADQAVAEQRNAHGLPLMPN